MRGLTLVVGFVGLILAIMGGAMTWVSSSLLVRRIPDPDWQLLVQGLWLLAVGGAMLRMALRKLDEK